MTKARLYGHACAIEIEVNPENLFGEKWPEIEALLNRVSGEITIEQNGKVGIRPHGTFHVGVAHAPKKRQEEYLATMAECNAVVGNKKQNFGFWVKGNACS